MKLADIRPFCGKRVLLKWTDLEHDWPAFKVVRVNDAGVWLKGVADPDGCPHDGGTFRVSASEILRMEEWP